MNPRLGAPLAFILGLFAFACGEAGSDETNDELGTSDESDTGTTETGTTETDTDTTETETGEPIPGCECILDEEFDGQVVEPSLPTCGEQLCAHIEVGADLAVMNPEAVDCALMALRDRTPGTLTWHWSLDLPVETYGYMQILEDGRGINRRWGVDDQGFQISNAELGELPAADYYDACLAEPDAFMRYTCVTTNLGSIDDFCDEGWDGR